MAASALPGLPAAGQTTGGDTLMLWAEATGRRRAAGRGLVGLRFAFYLRVSTEDRQDPVTSRARQRDQAAALVAGHRRMVAEFFDTGYSRTLAAPADPDCRWDANVMGNTSGPSAVAGIPRWRRCSSTTASSCGLRKSAGGSTSALRTARGRCWRWVCSPSGRSPEPGSGSGRRWPPRPASRAAIWAAARRTGTGTPSRRGVGTGQVPPRGRAGLHRPGQTGDACKRGGADPAPTTWDPAAMAVKYAFKR